MDRPGLAMRSVARFSLFEPGASPILVWIAKGALIWSFALPGLTTGPLNLLEKMLV